MKDKILGRPIRLNKKVLLPKGDYAEVMMIGDVHWGSPQCDKERFIANLEYCRQNRVYVLLMGDLVECATRHSVGAGVYEQETIVDTQHEQMLAHLKPLADSGLIIGTHRGNHGERVYRETGFDIDKALARELFVPFLSDACWSHFTVGKENYNIYSLHGRTGSRFDGTALLALERISSSFFGDMVVCGHSHKCINSIMLMQKVRNGLVVEHKKHLLIAGHYLRYDGGYGQTIGLPISKLGSPKVRFYGERHEITIHW